MNHGDNKLLNKQGECHHCGHQWNLQREDATTAWGAQAIQSFQCCVSTIDMTPSERYQLGLCMMSHYFSDRWCGVAWNFTWLLLICYQFFRWEANRHHPCTKLHLHAKFQLWILYSLSNRVEKSHAADQSTSQSPQQLM